MGMNLKDIAGMINGREYREETTPKIENIAKKYDVVIVFGASDDLCEFRGAIDEEIGAWEGTIAYLDTDGLLEHSDCISENCPYFEIKRKNAKKINVIWRDQGGWFFETDIPHETFTIIEDGERYGDGIVFALDSLK